MRRLPWLQHETQTVLSMEDVSLEQNAWPEGCLLQSHMFTFVTGHTHAKGPFSTDTCRWNGNWKRLLLDLSESSKYWHALPLNYSITGESGRERQNGSFSLRSKLCKWKLFWSIYSSTRHIFTAPVDAAQKGSLHQLPFLDLRNTQWKVVSSLVKLLDPFYLWSI